MILRTVAPAKVNWTLEVMGRRQDGYHEVRTVLQTVNLRDELWLEEDERISVAVEGAAIPPEKELVASAAYALRERLGRKQGCRIRLRKRIPPAAGLGGGSSDAAAALRGLNVLWKAGLTPDELSEFAAGLGSDVPFFLYGGTALAEGRGERLARLPDAPVRWLVLLLPAVQTERKTERMYGSLRQSDFMDGSKTGALVQRLRAGEAVREVDIYNAFERVAAEMWPETEACRSRLLAAGAPGAHLAGAGPALFTLVDGERQARRVASRLGGAEAGALAVRTLGAAEAIAIDESSPGPGLADG